MQDADSITNKNDQLMSPRERQYARPLKDCPSLLEWCSFFFQCYGQVVGPPVEYKDSVDFTHLKGDFAKMEPGSHVVPALKRLA